MRPPRGLIAVLSSLGLGEAVRSPEAIVAAWLDEPAPAAAWLLDGLDDLVGARGEEVRLPLSLWPAPNGAVGRVVLPASVAREVRAAARAMFEGRRLARVAVRTASAHAPATEGFARRVTNGENRMTAWIR